MTLIHVQEIVPGFHYWPEAPEEVAFLRANHRHLFHVVVTYPVDHANRELEFFIQQRELRLALGELFEFGPHGYLFGTRSCEHIAQVLLDYLDLAVSVAVFEDGENGATVTRKEVPHV